MLFLFLSVNIRCTSCHCLDVHEKHVWFYTQLKKNGKWNKMKLCKKSDSWKILSNFHTWDRCNIILTCLHDRLKYNRYTYFRESYLLDRNKITEFWWKKKGKYRFKEENVPISRWIGGNLNRVCFLSVKIICIFLQ